MKALQVSNRTARIANVPRPAIDGEALVRVLKSGICNTDLEIARGYAGFEGTIGHEFVGVVETADIAPDLVGKRVVGEINAGCGKCALCVAGDSRHCPDRTVLGIHGRDGAHAEFLTLPSRNLIEIPDSVSDDAAVFAEPLAAAHGIADRVSIDSDTSVAIIGDGKLGLLCAMTARLRSESVTLIGKHKEKMAIVDRLGVQTIDLAASTLPGRRFDVVIEGSGSESGFATALQLVRPRGEIVLKSTFHGESRWNTSQIVVDEISIVGSRCGRLAPAVELLASNKVQIDELISEELPLSEGVAALERARTPGIMKVILRP